eukprot:c25834_g1_i1.p1 GENE.c25834_g1_i1~~c25834_g1_i1.p1  ORF type:complete len:310 (+),score=60.00 c25834_g1_i1:28-957(+)
MSRAVAKHLTSAKTAHDDGIWCCVWTPDNRLVTGSVDETLKLWSVDGEDRIHPIREVGLRNELGVVSIDVDSQGKYVVSSAMDSHLRIWDLQTHECVQAIDCGVVQNWGVSFHPNCSQVATGGHKGVISVYAVESGQKIQTIDTKTDSMVMSIAYSPNGQLLACGTMDGSVVVFDASSGAELVKIPAHHGSVRSLCFTADSSTLLTASDDLHVKLFDVRGSGNLMGNLMGSCSGHASMVLCVACSQDGTLFATGSSDNTVKIWDLAEQTCIHTCTEHTDQVWGVAFNADGTRLASVSDDKTINIYSVPK